MSLVVTDLPLCGWSIVGTNFSGWVQIFQKNSFQGEPILGGSKLNVTNPWRVRVFFRVLPVLVTGRLPFAFFVSQIVLLIPRPFLVDVTHTAFLVKSSTSTSTAV